MSRKYYVWKDPACGGVNIEWVELTGKEFYAMIILPENKNRRFVRIGNEICHDADVIVLEATEAEYIAWRKEQDAHRYLHKFDKGLSNPVSLDGDVKDGDSGSLHEVVADEQVNVEREALHHLAHKQLEMALQALDDEDAALLSEVYLKGKTYADVARNLGVNRSTVQGRITAIISRLQKFF